MMQPRTIGEEVDAAMERFKASADKCGDRYQEHATRYDDTGDLVHMSQGEYELGRASGYLAAVNELHRLRAMLVASGADRIPVKGQRIPREVAGR